MTSLDAAELLVARVVIPQLHDEMLEDLIGEAEFVSRIRSNES